MKAFDPDRLTQIFKYRLVVWKAFNAVIYLMLIDICVSDFAKNINRTYCDTKILFIKSVSKLYYL